MGIEAPGHLAAEDVAILRTLWDDLYQPMNNGCRGTGLTREQLAVLLVQDRQHKDRPFKTRSALDRHLTGLKQLTELVFTDTAPARSKKQPGQTIGHRRDLYTLAEGKGITWATTARIVMEVWNSTGHHIPEKLLMARMCRLKLRRDVEGPKLTKVEIIADVNFSIEKKYINRYGADIRGDERLRFEIDYINEIAAHCVTG